jgi:uncharacterized protein with HEPN domain
LRDILESIAAIEDFAGEMDLDSFREDPKTIAAVERKLLVISEAAIRLGEQAATLCPGPPWHKIRGTGNWLRHQYDRVDVETVWRTVIEDLPTLKTAVANALARDSK